MAKEIEYFDGSKYWRNNQVCNAKVVYKGKETFGKPQFCIIEKQYAPWDGNAFKSYSIGWYQDKEYWVLGLPRELKDVAKIIELFGTYLQNMN